jgi:sulfite exporter TauE/SafE
MESLPLLLLTAVTIGVVHTLIGPDHYIPFVAMARIGRWSLARTWLITGLCGIGHVLGSIALGALGIALGWAVERLEWVESWRGDGAAWLLLGFGLAYTLWGLRQALLNRPHTHFHAHDDGTVHSHEHGHHGAHLHLHESSSAPTAAGPATHAKAMTPWILFVIFAFGPCEPLIPLLMYPAAQGSAWGVAAVSLVFALATIVTMLTCVTIGVLGLQAIPGRGLERFSHALAGLAVFACGLAIKLGL